VPGSFLVRLVAECGLDVSGRNSGGFCYSPMRGQFDSRCATWDRRDLMRLRMSRTVRPQLPNTIQQDRGRCFGSRQGAPQNRRFGLPWATPKACCSTKPVRYAPTLDPGDERHSGTAQARCSERTVRSLSMSPPGLARMASMARIPWQLMTGDRGAALAAFRARPSDRRGTRNGSIPAISATVCSVLTGALHVAFFSRVTGLLAGGPTR
jgi:hypothetical protein